MTDIPHEFVRTIGLAPDWVLVGGIQRAPIYAVDKATGSLKQTRPPRGDATYIGRLVGTKSALVAADVFTPGTALHFLSHCLIGDCSATTIPPVGSYTFDDIQDFAFDPGRGRVFWFDSTSRALTLTSADAWAPTSNAVSTVNGGSNCFAMAWGAGRVFGVFSYGIFAIPDDGTAAPTKVSGFPASESTIRRIVTSPESLIIHGYSGALYRVPLPAGIADNPPDPLFGVTGVTAIATSGSKLFWAGTSTIYSCNLPLCAQTVQVAQDVSVIRDLIADDIALYWISHPDIADPTVSVMRLAL